MPDGNKNNTQDIQPEWKQLLTAIESYLESRNKEKRFSEIMYGGIKTFMSISSVISCHLFLYYKDKSDFMHKVSLPEISLRDGQKFFDYAIEQQAIGEALNSNRIITIKAVKRKVGHLLIVPLCTSNGIVGLVLIHHQHSEEVLGQLILRLFSLHASLFAGALENYFFMNDLEQAKKELEQKVALRTMQLSESQREVNSIFDSVLTGILVIDEAQDTISRVNPFAIKLIRDEEKNILGKKPSDFLKNSNGKSNFQLNKSFESELCKNGDEVIPILRNTSRLIIGKKRYIIESFVDISDSKKAVQALKDYNEILELKVQERTEELQLLVSKLKKEVEEKEQAEHEVRNMLSKEKELSELRNRFVSMVSHEFRTPLTVIRSYSQMIEKFHNKLPKQEQLDYLKRISMTVDNMTELIENVIFIGKSSSDNFIPEIKKYNLSKLCNGVIEEVKLTQEKPRTVDFVLDDSLNEISVDKKILRLILTNLLTNALKYSAPDKSVLLEVTREDKYLTFKVEDQGIGIPEKDLKNIFEVFYRAKNVGSVSGTGIGMSVVLESIKKMNGEIQVSSEEGKGTIVFFKIPYDFRSQ